MYWANPTNPPLLTVLRCLRPTLFSNRGIKILKSQNNWQTLPPQNANFVFPGYLTRAQRYASIFRDVNRHTSIHVFTWTAMTSWSYLRISMDTYRYLIHALGHRYSALAFWVANWTGKTSGSTKSSAWTLSRLIERPGGIHEDRKTSGWNILR